MTRCIGNLEFIGCVRTKFQEPCSGINTYLISILLTLLKVNINSTSPTIRVSRSRICNFIYLLFFFLKQSIPNKARLKPLELAKVTSGGGEEIDATRYVII